MSSREGAPDDHRRQLDRAKPDPALPRLKVHCADCDEVASVIQIDNGGQFLSFWDGYRWYGLAAACGTHGFLALDLDTTIREFYEARGKKGGVAHYWVKPMH